MTAGNFISLSSHGLHCFDLPLTFEPVKKYKNAWRWPIAAGMTPVDGHLPKLHPWVIQTIDNKEKTQVMWVISKYRVSVVVIFHNPETWITGMTSLRITWRADWRWEEIIPPMCHERETFVTFKVILPSCVILQDITNLIFSILNVYFLYIYFSSFFNSWKSKKKKILWL